MTREKLAEAFEKSGLRLISREAVDDYELFIGDGFSSAPHLRWQRFGVEPDDFPAGMFVTFWWLGRAQGDDVKLHIGRPVFMEPTELIPLARINAAKADARKALTKLKVRHH